jgi:hypothetical protein
MGPTDSRVPTSEPAIVNVSEANMYPTMTTPNGAVRKVLKRLHYPLESRLDQQ